MRSRKLGIWIVSVLLLGAVAFFNWSRSDGEEYLYFSLVAHGKSEVIRSWQDTEGSMFVFLPGYGELNQLEIRTTESVTIGQIRMSNGMTCEKFSLDTPYALEFQEKRRTTITFLKSENLPAMYIDTVSGSMDYVHQAKENIEPGRMRLYTEQGKLDYAGKIESIKIRGNNLSAPKKPYSLKLSIDGDLLGMGQAEKWILLANYFDPTHMRNKIVFDFAEDFGLQYSPKSRWMDVYLNGEYAGLYLLCERNEVHLQRVDVKKDSFLVSTELEERLINQNLPYVVTKKGVAIRIHDTTLDADGLAEKIQSAEDAIYAENGIDPFTGKHWTELIDLDSWMRKYLIEEVFGNVDGGRLSQFFYFDGTEKKIYAGPVWDYDMAMANPNIFREAVPEMFYVNCPAAYDGSAWFYALYQNDMFYSNMVELYKTEFLPLMTKLLNGGITEYMRKINRSACLDQLRWKTEPARENVEKIQTYLKERIVFLNSIWIENQKYAAVHGMSYYRYVTYAVPIGGYLPPLVEEENFQWYITETETLLDVTKPIFEDMYIEQRFVGDPSQRPKGILGS